MTEWSYFSNPGFEMATNKYLPDMGEGETMATQIVTAVCKLVYKFYNDGDVYDNTGMLDGWCNDLSSYANWLRSHTNATAILDEIWDCRNEDEYSDILRKLADRLLDDEDLERWNKVPADGSIYDAEGPYTFVEYNDDEEEDDWYEEEEEEDW